jgi:large subunit ribosomal protein L4
MEIKLVDNQGKTSAKKIKASDAIFAQDFKETLVHQLVVSYMANQRVATRAQKTRGEVKHSTRKPFRQKGTGNARAGMTSSPIWRSGGRAFPNRPDENFSKKINKKAYRAGMKSILSELLRQDRLTVVEEFKVDKPKTKVFNSVVKKFSSDQNILIITNEFDENLYLSSRNIPSALVVEARYIDPVSLVHFSKVVVTKDALKTIEEMFA